MTLLARFEAVGPVNVGDFFTVKDMEDYVQDHITVSSYLRSRAEMQTTKPCGVPYEKITKLQALVLTVHEHCLEPFEHLDEDVELTVEIYDRLLSSLGMRRATMPVPA